MDRPGFSPAALHVLPGLPSLSGLRSLAALALALLVAPAAGGGTLSGRLERPAGAMPPARVLLFGPQGETLAGSHVGPDGTFHLEAPEAAGVLTLRLQAEHHLPMEISMPARGEPIELPPTSLPPAGRVAGRILADGERPVAGARVLTPSPTAAWGLHLLDGNVALGDLVGVVHRQGKRYLHQN